MAILRKTKLVEAILHIFEEQHSALSVVDLVKRFEAKANKTTIYRILDRLEKEGFVHSFKGQQGLTWYAKCFSDCSSNCHHDIHPHFQCQECGKTECLPVSINLPPIPSHQIDFAQVILVGRCEACLS